MAIEQTIAIFLGGLGLGAVLPAVIQHFLLQRAKSFDTRISERKSAFDGFLVALTALEKHGSRENQLDFALWEARIKLVASDKVIDAIIALKVTEPGTSSRKTQVDAVLEAVRHDLGIC